MDEAVSMCTRGAEDANVRVRYAALSGLAMLFTELAPKVQVKYVD